MDLDEYLLAKHQVSYTAAGTQRKALGRAPPLLGMAGNSLSLLLQAAVGSSHSGVCDCLISSLSQGSDVSPPFDAFSFSVS